MLVSVYTHMQKDTYSIHTNFSIAVVPATEGCVNPMRGDMVRYSEIQLDTARYVRMQLDTVGYSEIQWIYCKMARY